MSENREIRFRYIFPEGYNPIYCNGAYGGISPHGEIVANFFMERLPIPNSVTQEVNSQGTLSGIIETEPSDIENIIIRYISTGIILTEDNAKAIYEWLGDQIQELENRKQVNDEIIGDISE